MLNLLLEYWWVTLSLSTVVLVIAVTIFSGTWMIGANQSGLVVKRFGPALASGHIIAINGEAGYQARLLSPGWHFGLWRWRFRVIKVPITVVRPGEIALIVAADGVAMPSERVLGKFVPCHDFQDAEAFLAGGGERGRQLAMLTAGTYRINPALFEVVTTASASKAGMSPNDLRVYQVQPERVGIVTALDGRPIAAGDLAGPIVPGHESFQRGQAFIDAGGCRGLQEEVLLSGSWNLNPWFVQVEQVALVEVPIGYVGVVVSYVGREHVDLSGESFTHGDLVERGRKGVWMEPLLPGKHPLNTRVMKVELVPTTNIVLNWAQQTEAHHYDERLSSIIVRSKDGFSFSLDVAQIIHIGMRNAPRVISRVGSMQNLVDHVLQPTVGNYFRNSAQQVTVLEFLSARSERQRHAFEDIRKAIESYDVECIDTLVGDIAPPAELMRTQTDRKIAEELERTYEVQREAQIKRQALERETAVANMQIEVVRSEQMVKVAQQNALAVAEQARGEGNALELRAQGEGNALRLRAEGQAASVKLAGDAEASAVRAIGAAKAAAYTAGREAIGEAGYTAMQIATILGENHVKVVPDIAVTGDGTSGMANVMLAKLVAASKTDKA
jgi:uncharacterized membrane protein YqiK